jgi:DNA-binding response OmpR family regulator
LSNITDRDKPQILLAEDEEHIAKLVAFKLEREGYGVTVAHNGLEAINFLALRPWALIILDVMMPIHDGWHVLKTIRGLPMLSGTPVLMLTAKGHDTDRANAVELGAQDFVRKLVEGGGA